MQVVNLFDVVIVKVKEDQVRQADEVFNACDQVMLQIKKPKSFFTFEKRHVRKLPFIKLQSLRIGSTFTWLTIDYKDARYLGKFCKDDFVFIFNTADNTIGQKVPVALIILALVES